MLHGESYLQPFRRNAQMSQQLTPTYSIEDSRVYVNGLVKEAEEHRALHHPYLEALSQGTLPDPLQAIRDLSHQYLAYSENFLRYLTATISQLESREHREALMSNLMEESGVYPEGDVEELEKHGIKLEWVNHIPHPRLFMRFLEALEMDKEWLKSHPFCDEAVIWGELFLQCCSGGGPAQAVGAMGIGTESIVKLVYRPIITAIKTHLNISPRDRVFFDLHAAVDDEHGETLQNIAVSYAQFRRHRPLLRRGVLMALNLRTAFFDSMLVRAEKMKPQKIRLREVS